MLFLTIFNDFLNIRKKAKNGFTRIFRNSKEMPYFSNFLFPLTLKTAFERGGVKLHINNPILF